MMEERQSAKPSASATWLVMQLQSCGSPRKTMEQRKVTTSEKSSEKLSRASLALTRGVPLFSANTTCMRDSQKKQQNESVKPPPAQLQEALTPTAMVTSAPNTEMTMRVMPSGSPKARNSMIFGTQASLASLDQSSSPHRMHSRASVRKQRRN